MVSRDGEASVSALSPLELEQAVDVAPVHDDENEGNGAKDGHEHVTLEVEDEELGLVEGRRVHDGEVLGDGGRGLAENVVHL